MSFFNETVLRVCHNRSSKNDYILTGLHFKIRKQSLTMARSGGAPFSLGLKGNKQEHFTTGFLKTCSVDTKAKSYASNHYEHGWHHTYWKPVMHEHFRSRLTLLIVKSLVSTWYKQNKI